jgi:hypothetical protein
VKVLAAPGGGLPPEVGGDGNAQGSKGERRKEKGKRSGHEQLGAPIDLLFILNFEF